MVDEDVDEEGDDNDQDEPDDAEPEPEPVPLLDENGQEIEKPEVLPFRERDYILRRTYSAFQRVKTVETLCLSAGKSNPNLHAYVLCNGLPYGLGEDVLFPVFQRAWLQEPPFIPYYGKGKNKIPTIHFKDISMHVKYIIYKKPKGYNYVFGIDHTKNRTQKSMMKAIAQGIGIPNLKQEEVTEEKWETPNFDLFMVDLWMKPSNIFKLKAEGDEDDVQDDDDQDDADPSQPKRRKLKMKFDWWCQSGIAKNIEKLCKEFNEVRGLKPNRILISGPPLSGNSFYAKKLADFYNIPLINVKEVAEKCQKLEGELGDEVRANLEDQRRTMMEEAQTELDKKRSQGIKGLPEELKEEDVSIFNSVHASPH